MPPMKKWPDIRTTGIAGTFDQVVLIDNKQINDKIAEGRAARKMAVVSGQVEKQLAQHIGFRGKGTDASSKADFQQFDITLADAAIEALQNPVKAAQYSPATMGFLQALIGRARLHEVYASTPSRIVGEGPQNIATGPGTLGTPVSGLGAELKLGLDVMDIGEVSAGRGAYPGRTITQETQMAAGQISGADPLRDPQAGYEMDVFKREREAWQKTTGKPAGAFFAELLYNPALAKKVFKNPAKLKAILQKTRNLFTTVSFRGGKTGKVFNFLYFVKDLKPGRADIDGSIDVKRIQWQYTSAFEKKVAMRVAEMLGEDGQKAIENETIRNEVSALGLLSLSDDISKHMYAQTRLNTVASIPIYPVANVKVPPLKRKQKISPQRRPARRGQFISNVQFSALLQKRLAEKMPRYPEPRRPTPRYVTGRLARSFQIMTNYRQGIIGFFNTPPASGYVDELNENGWLLDQTLVQPTIRQITQQLFGRQFRVLRTQ